MKEIKFTACKQLNYNDDYSAKKVVCDSYGIDKVCLDRPVIDSSYPRYVQFCKLRGRLNKPFHCLCEENSICSDYEDFEHTVKLDSN
jgi:hypothetical protein